MGDQTVYTKKLAGVNWQGMKAVLIADDFDNGRSAEQLQRSFTNSFAACLAYRNGELVGTARILSDGVCNAYLVDVWTHSPYRGQGVGRGMIARLLEEVPGQHVYLFTDDMQEFYRRIGFVERGTGMEIVVGRWLDN